MDDITDTPTDPMAELTAMTEIAKALQPLDTDAVRRVLIWAGDRFNAGVSLGAPAVANDSNTNDADSSQNSDSQDDFTDVADLFAAANPRNDPQKALLVAYWFQKLNGQPDFESAAVNKELKHLGHGVANITAALSSLMTRKPQLVIQTKKSGSSQQARKRYKLTNEGVKQVERMIRGEE